jgi:AcrR family transcriptional regulator
MASGIHRTAERDLMSTTATATQPRLRADAARNRERILAAARDAFVAEGDEAALDEIARRAGVGNATLYRHFPDRQSLVYHVMLYVKQRIVERAESLLEADVDPFEALSEALLSSSEEPIGALCTLLMDSGLDPEDPELLASRDRVMDAMQRLVDRARASGQLRDDVGSVDLLLAVGRLTRPMPREHRVKCPTTAIPRILRIFLDGLRAPARSELPGTALEVADLTARDEET